MDEGQRNIISVKMISYIVHSCVRVMQGKLYESRVRDHVVVHVEFNVSNSNHNSRCVVDDSNTISVYVLLTVGTHAQRRLQ